MFTHEQTFEPSIGLNVNMTRLLGSSKISPRYQITIPEDVRKSIKIEVGATIGFAQDDKGKIYLITEL